MAGGGAARFGLAALLAPATPTPTPFPPGQAGCHQWRYRLHWDRPSRLATLKNALGNSVTIYENYKAPGAGMQADWPDPMTNSVDWTGNPNPGAWNYASPPASAATTFAYNHGGGILYAAGYADASGAIVAPADPQGEVVDWSWTLDYGFGVAPGNDIIYGLDPGPPLAVYDLTAEAVSGNSIPGITGTPLTFANAFNSGGLPQQQPTWKTLLPSDVIGKTKDLVNWGLMTFQDVSVDPQQSAWCSNAANYDVKVPIVSNDSGDVTAIEDYMRLKYYSSGPHPGLSAAGGTPTKHALELAGASLRTSWDTDPKKACSRPWGVILCTDGLSNTCNTGAVPDAEWIASKGNTPCESDVNGTDFANYPPGAAEAIYDNALIAFPGAAVIKPRTYAIGIAPEVGRCELNRVAYRGRSDAGAPDAGFLLYDPTAATASCPTPLGDFDLPHVDPITADESGPGAPPVPNRFRQDQTPPGTTDYAFFAFDSGSIRDAVTNIVLSTGAGDYSTSAPVGGVSASAVGSQNLALLASTDFPSWRGHFRQIDTTKTPGDPGYVVWDAGLVLAAPTQPWQPTPATRAIYTWDPATGTLIPVDTNAAHLASMAALAGNAGFDAHVVDFVRGNDGTLTNTIRAKKVGCTWSGWLLGPIINATAGVVGTPHVYKQAGNVALHKPFETTYADRRTLVWVGSNDGMVHAFDFDDGTEVMALLPPNLLANQISLYQNFKTVGVNDAPTGQVKPIDQQVWGVASSFRFADIFDGTGYKTVGFLTEGPGGNLVSAIDITHPYPGRPTATPAVPADPNYDSANPVTVLWTKDATDYAGLHGSWSVPAIAADAFTTSRMFFGAGINPASLYSAQADATLYIVDPTDGTLNKAQTIAASGSPSPLVGQQTFADAVFFQTKVSSYLPDNVANLDVQADTNGRAWFTWGNFAAGSTTSRVGIDLNYAAAAANVSGTQTPVPQPIYYSPAVTGQGTSGCQFYALASGSLYETSPTVSGWNVNRTGAPLAPFPNSLPPFTPYLYVGVNPNKITSGAFASVPLGKAPNDVYILKQRVGGEVPEALDLPPGDPGFTETPPRTKLGIHTQVTSSPVMIVDVTGVGEQQALFLLYDPDAGCNGRSYIAILTFQVATGCGRFKDSAFIKIDVFGAGPGAASGFTVAAGELFASKSSPGGAGGAFLYRVNIPVNTLTGPPSFQPLWWRDVK
jgi:hypothetical protein